jgi:transposase
MTRKAYPCDVTDREWQIIEPLLPEAQGIGRPRQVDLREIVNGIFYVLREGCSWRALPHDLPPWQTVYNYFRHWQRLGVWQEIHTKIRNQVRKRLEKIDNPTAGIIDSQSVKTAEKRGKCTVTMVENSLIATQALYLSGYFRTLVSCYGDGSQLS